MFVQYIAVFFIVLFAVAFASWAAAFLRGRFEVALTPDEPLVGTGSHDNPKELEGVDWQLKPSVDK